MSNETQFLDARPITDTIRRIGGGTYIDTASAKLAELVAAVGESGKAGKITLVISVKKATRGGAMIVSGTVSITKPAEAAMESLLFATPEGNLIADDPNQQKLDLRSVTTNDITSTTLKTA